VKFMQQGNTLIISLIILLVLTVVGISSIGNVTLSQKMATNYRDADVVFQAAEAALAEGERKAEELSASLQESYFAAGCASEDCFTALCNNGKCFNGTFEAADPCWLSEPATELARDEATWTTVGSALDSQLSFTGLTQKPQIIIEFLCYVQVDPTVTLAVPTPPYAAIDWNYFYRITSYARGVNGSSRAMLQSTYKVAQ
jgi:type IV pilus assembly protein PilX